MKIYKTVLCVNIGDVTNPYLVGGCRDYILNEIGVLVHPPGAESSTGASSFPIYLQVLTIQKIKQSVTSDANAIGHPGINQHPQFPTTYTSHVSSVFGDKVQDNTLFCVFPIIVVQFLIISLPSFAKQRTKLLQR
jgi:hypothetical protein